MIFQINGKGKESILHWSNFRGAINSPFHKNREKYGKLGWNPSAKKGLIHFLLGAMLPCSNPFSTSVARSPDKLHVEVLLDVPDLVHLVAQLGSVLDPKCDTEIKMPYLTGIQW